MSDNPRNINIQRCFNNYLYLPSEVRIMIIDEMQADDRCRFTRCSKLCTREAKTSKNYIYGLNFTFYERMVYITVSHDKNKGFIWDIRKIGEVKYIICEKIRGHEMWRDELDTSIDLHLYAAEKARNLLQVYQNRKRVSFNGSAFFGRLKDYDFGVHSFNSLEELDLAGDMDVRGYLSKIRGPLKNLKVRQTMLDMDNYADCEQVYQVKRSLHMSNLKLNNEQFLRLSASHVKIHIGYLTVNDIFRFIKSWQNGSIEKKMKNYEWCKVSSSGYDLARLFRRLGMGFEDSQSEHLELEIKHNLEAGRTGTLRYRRQDLWKMTFIVKNGDGQQ